MRTFNHIYKSDEKLEQFIKEIQVRDSNKILIRIHSAIHTYTQMDNLISLIHVYLPSSNIVGCSTTAIIFEGSIIQNSCLVSITEFEDVDITVGRISCYSKDGEMLSGEALAQNLLKDIPQRASGAYMLTFFPITYGRIHSVVAAINKSGRKIKMLGGTAYVGDEREDNPCYVISGESATPGEVAYAYIESPGTSIYTDYACGVEAVGKKSPITAKGNIIESVDNMQGGEWYAGLLGKAELNKNPSISEAFPIVMQDGRGIAYHVDYKKYDDRDEYYLETFPELSSGSLVSPGYFHPQKIFDEVSDMVHNVSTHPSQTIFGYDCFARSGMLSDCAKWEINAFENTSISGCLLSGEISHRKGENIYANLTFVISSLSEDNESYFPVDELDIASVALLQEENVRSLNFLLANATKSLSDELAHQQDMLRDAVFYNPAVGIDNQLKYQFDNERDHLDKVAIFYLNNEKMLRLFSGVTETYGYLTDCYQKLTMRFDGKDIRFYSYQDTSLLIAAGSKLSTEEFESLTDEIQKFLHEQVYGEIRLSYIVATIENSDDALSNLELAIDYARSKKKIRVKYEDIAGDLEKQHENVHMLWVVREALNHKRIKPYFQEIHSNKPGKKRLFEALMRITDEDGKIYFPDTFLPVAKEYALYDKLSQIMVETVMDMFKDKEARVTLNLNVQDIYNRNMIKMIFEKLRTFPKPQNYVFEIVESEEISDYEYIKSFADKVHEYGGKVAIDDFGSGFSNMLHVMRIDADYIKIDGAIIREIISDPLVEDFVEFMQGWCVKNREALICEYIENKEIQDIMEKHGIAYSQGYYFSKPHPWGPEDE